MKSLGETAKKSDNDVITVKKKKKSVTWVRDKSNLRKDYQFHLKMAGETISRNICGGKKKLLKVRIKIKCFFFL